jgi:hypothetical protein
MTAVQYEDSEWHVPGAMPVCADGMHATTEQMLTEARMIACVDAPSQGFMALRHKQEPGRFRDLSGCMQASCIVSSILSSCL